MRLVDPRPHVELREGEVVLSFPYDSRAVDLVRRIPGRRFDWDAREWLAPVSDWTAVHVAGLLAAFPALTPSDEAAAWLAEAAGRWVARVRAVRFDGRGWWRVETWSGEVPAPVRADAREHEGALLVPFTAAAAAELRAQQTVQLDAAAERCLDEVEAGREPPGARVVLRRGVEGERLVLERLWDGDAQAAFAALPQAGRTGALPLDPWLTEPLDEFLAAHDVEVRGPAVSALEALRAERAEAAAAVRRSRATEAEPIDDVAARLGGTLEPFQWAAVRYALDARRTFLADEQGLGKTVEALAALEAAGAFPAVVVCPASLKLNWEREARRWLGHRSVAVVEGRVAVPPTGDITILNYEIVAAHTDALTRLRPRAVVVDEAHYCKNPRAKRTRAVRRLAGRIGDEGLVLLLTGTPVLNHSEELVAQLRVLGRLAEFGSGAEFARRFRHDEGDERLHWHLRRRCFVRRVKADVLPQLPAKRRVVVPVALDNEREYRLAEEDVVAWLRSQPHDLGTLEAKIAATLRAERLAQLGALQRLAARGKLAAALGWVEDFLASGERLVVFARHIEVQEALLTRFPAAAHLLGRDPTPARQAAVEGFQRDDGAQLLVGATRVAGQGITLTRASNVAFLELEWTPAMHDQAEDRCHRIGQRDAVTAWYLLAAGTIDETMAQLIERKRSTVAAVTDGRRLEGENLVDAVVRELREGRPLRRLRAVG